MRYVLDDNLDVLGEQDDTVIGNPLVALIPGLVHGLAGGGLGGGSGGGGGGGTKDTPHLSEEQVRRLVAEERARQEAAAREKLNRTLLYIVAGVLGAGVVGLGTYVALKKK
jgi:hypothetical protein